MTCNITNTPWVEPLPLYSRNDPDAVSIHSAAPSYVSETPTYHSDRQNGNVTSPPRRSPPLIGPATARDQRHTQIPTPQFAPGFTSRAVGAVTTLNSHLYNSGSWSSTRSSHASRQYINVAKRRANQATPNTPPTIRGSSLSTSAVLPSLTTATTTTTTAAAAAAAGPSTSSTSPTASSTNLHGGSSPANHPMDSTSSPPPQPLNPLEDPYLVGEAAAERARAQRVYREMCLRGEEGLRYESRSWDFMFSQMADWEERGQSWRGFRERVSGTKLLGRRLGLRG